MALSIRPTHDSLTIVLRGDFNPMIFSQHWFLHHKLIEMEECDAAKVKIIHQQVADIEFSWFNFTIQDDTFAIATQEKPFIRLCDLVASIFGTFLTHTPIRAIGLNRGVHYNSERIAARIALGRKLAPLYPWGKWGDEVANAALENTGGLQSLTMRQPLNDDRRRGFVQVKIEPSIRIPNNTGIFVEINDHYEVSKSEEAIGSAEKMTETLQKNFDKSMEKSEQIIDWLMQETKRGLQE